MKVAIISRGYPSKRYPLNGIFEFDQAKALVKAGVDVVFLAIDMRSLRRWRKWGYDTKVIDGVKIYSVNIPCGRIPKKIFYTISSSALKKLFGKVFSTTKFPDVIHSHYAGVNYISAKMNEETNLPHVMTEHLSTVMSDNPDSYIIRIATDAYAHANVIIAVSPKMQTVLKERFSRDAVYVPNVIDATLFKPFNKEERQDSPFIFISVARLIFPKRVDLIVQSFIKAFECTNNVLLTIIGDGPERSRLEKLIRSNNMCDRIKLLGMCTRTEVAQIMQQSDCFVLPSRTETFGVVYIEALACGIPVIATKCGGPDEIITKDNGILIPIDDVNALANAMLQVKESKKQYNKEQISRNAKNKFSEKSVAKELIKVYNCAIIDKEKGKTNK